MKPTRILLTLVLILFSITSFSQFWPKIDSVNYMATNEVRFHENGTNKELSIEDVFSIRDSAFYVKWHDFFSKIIFTEEWTQYEKTGTYIRQRSGIDDGGFKTQVSVCYDKDQDLTFVTIDYKDVRFFFDVHETDKVAHTKLRKGIQMHEMHKENYTQEEIEFFMKYFGAQLFMEGGE